MESRERRNKKSRRRHGIDMAVDPCIILLEGCRTDLSKAGIQSQHHLGTGGIPARCQRASKGNIGLLCLSNSPEVW